MKNNTITGRWNDVNEKDNTAFKMEPRDDSAIPISQKSFVSEKILHGMLL
jgi:hypothetical protein